MEKVPDKNRLQREALLLISPENTFRVKRKNIKEPARREIKEFEQRKGISTSAGVKGRRLLLLIAMIGVVQVNVTQTSKKMKAKRKEENTQGGEVCQLRFLKYSDPKSIKKSDWIRCQRNGKWYREVFYK